MRFSNTIVSTTIGRQSQSGKSQACFLNLCRVLHASLRVGCHLLTLNPHLSRNLYAHVGSASDMGDEIDMDTLTMPEILRDMDIEIEFCLFDLGLDVLGGVFDSPTSMHWEQYTYSDNGDDVDFTYNDGNLPAYSTPNTSPGNYTYFPPTPPPTPRQTCLPTNLSTPQASLPTPPQITLNAFIDMDICQEILRPRLESYLSDFTLYPHDDQDDCALVLFTPRMCVFDTEVTCMSGISGQIEGEGGRDWNWDWRNRGVEFPFPVMSA